MKFARMLAKDFNRMMSDGPLPSWHGASVRVFLVLGAVMLLCWAVLMGYVLP